MDDSGWYYRNNNNQAGPISKSELQELIKTGIVKKYSLIWHPSLKDWTPLSETAFKDFLPHTSPTLLDLWANVKEVGHYLQNKLIAIIKKCLAFSETIVRTNSDTKLCPYCNTSIKTLAIYCRHCQRYLNEESAKKNSSDSPEAVSSSGAPRPDNIFSNNPIIDFYKNNKKTVFIVGGILFQIIIALIIFFNFFSEESKVRNQVEPILKGTSIEIADVYVKGKFACVELKSKTDSSSVGIPLTKIYGKWFYPPKLADKPIMSFSSCVKVINRLEQ